LNCSDLCISTTALSTAKSQLRTPKQTLGKVDSKFHDDPTIAPPGRLINFASPIRASAKSSYAPQLYDASRLLRLKSLEEEEAQLRYDVLGRIDDVEQESYKERQSLLKRLSPTFGVVEEPEKTQRAPDVRYKNYAPSFGQPRASVSGKDQDRWLSLKQRNLLTRTMHRKIKEIAFQESQANMLNRESHRRQTDHKFLQRELKKMIVKRVEERMEQGEKLRKKARKQKGAEKFSARISLRWSRGEKVSPLFTLMRAAKAKSRAGTPQDKVEGIVHPVESRKQEMTDSYLEEAMKDERRHTENTTQKKTPTLFNAKLARKDSLDVQYRSYLRSMDRDSNNEADESSECLLSANEKPVDLRLFLPKVSGVSDDKFLDEPWCPPRLKDVDEMMKFALTSNAKPSMFGCPDAESSRRPAEDTKHKKRHRRRSRGFTSTDYERKMSIEHGDSTGSGVEENGLPKQKSMVLGRDIRFARDSLLSEEDLYEMAKQKRVRFLMPRPEDVITCEPVYLEGQKSTRRSAKKFENFRQRKMVGSLMVFPKTDESTKGVRPSGSADDGSGRFYSDTAHLATYSSFNNRMLLKRRHKPIRNSMIAFAVRNSLCCRFLFPVCPFETTSKPGKSFVD
ncbi:hypothetical protein RvY_10427-2, partial [Ramazzottius varieornatus]